MEFSSFSCTTDRKRCQCHFTRGFGKDSVHLLDLANCVCGVSHHTNMCKMHSSTSFTCWPLPAVSPNLWKKWHIVYSHLGFWASTSNKIKLIICLVCCFFFFSFLILILTVLLLDSRLTYKTRDLEGYTWSLFRVHSSPSWYTIPVYTAPWREACSVPFNALLAFIRTSTPTLSSLSINSVDKVPIHNHTVLAKQPGTSESPETKHLRD